jgi:hypothetical protein
MQKNLIDFVYVFLVVILSSDTSSFFTKFPTFRFAQFVYEHSVSLIHVLLKPEIKEVKSYNVTFPSPII